MVVHDPLGNRPANGIMASNHKVKGQSKAVVTRFVGIAPNSMNGSRELGQDDLSIGNYVGLAIGSWDCGSTGTSALAALEIGGAWAQVYSKFILRLER